MIQFSNTHASEGQYNLNTKADKNLINWTQDSAASRIFKWGHQPPPSSVSGESFVKDRDSLYPIPYQC